MSAGMTIVIVGCFWIVLMLLAWVFYMLTFRTDDWIRLRECDRKDKELRKEAVGKAAGIAAGAASMVAQAAVKRLLKE